MLVQNLDQDHRLGPRKTRKRTGDSLLSSHDALMFQLGVMTEVGEQAQLQSSRLKLIVKLRDAGQLNLKLT